MVAMCTSKDRVLDLTCRSFDDSRRISAAFRASTLHDAGVSLGRLTACVSLVDISAFLVVDDAGRRFLEASKNTLWGHVADMVHWS
jgi:hypothetical protein